MRVLRPVAALLIALGSLFPLIAQDEFDPQPADYFVNPAVVIEDLPRLLTNPPTDSTIGEIRAAVLPHLGRLFIQVGEAPFQFFNVPAEWGFITDGGVEIIPLNADGLTLYCSYPASTQAPFTVDGVGVTIDPGTGNVSQVGCIVTPDQSGYSHAEPSTSPGGVYTLSVVPTRGLTEQECPPDDYIPLFGYASRLLVNGESIGCISLDGIEIRAWIDEARALLRTFDPKNTSPLIERWYIVDAAQPALLPLGLTMTIPFTFSDPLAESTLLLADTTLAARWMIQSVGEGIPSGESHVPETCMLELLDLTTLDAVQFNDTPSSCLFYPQITVSQGGERLLYVRSIPNADPLLVGNPTMTAMLVDPGARTERALAITGTTVHIVSISPDGRRALFIVDQGAGARHNPFEDGIAYTQPTWVVYDLDADAPIYTAPAITSSHYGHIYDSTYGMLAFHWTDDGWNALFHAGVYRLPLTIMDWSDETLSEIPLEGLPRSNRYYVYGSPDGHYATIVTDLEGISYLVDRRDGRIAEFRPARAQQPTTPPYLNVRWRDDGLLEGVFTHPDDLLMLRRWLIDPARAFAD